MERLDPPDWGAFAGTAHRAVDQAIARTAALRDRPVTFSDTTIHGEHGLRAAICNHRTTDGDIDMAIAAVVATGDNLACAA